MSAQTTATLDLGASAIEYDGFLVSGAALASPSIRYEARNISVGAQGAWVLFESGNTVLQGRAAAAWLTPTAGRWRAELSGSLGASKYADAAGFAHFLGRARAHYRDGLQGAWFGAATGRQFGDSTVIPVELGAGVWGVRAPFAFSGTLTGSWLDEAGYIDLIGAARWSQGTLQLDGQVGARTSSDGFGRGAFGELSALIRFSDNLRIVLSGGRYPSDPVRGVVGADYVTLGLRVALTPAREPLVPTLADAMLRAADALEESDYGSTARLEIASSGDLRTIRVYVSDARTVELMADFTDWEPIRLRRIDRGGWETELEIPRGIHRLNIRLDGGPWLVPRGTRLQETEFGGAVGVVVVP